MRRGLQVRDAPLPGDKHVIVSELCLPCRAVAMASLEHGHLGGAVGISTSLTPISLPSP